MIIVYIFIGIALLFWGRELFWLFVGGIGFVAGFMFATDYLQLELGWLVLVVAVAVGLIGAVLAVVFQSIAIGIGGFLSGGYLAIWITKILNLNFVQFPLLIFLIGGIMGLILIFVVFDWAIIALSSLTGASLLLNVVRLKPPFETLLFFLLVIAGVLVQANFMKSKSRST